ncbi:MAG TPA: hypothetical protein VHN79_13145 [Lacunisphaera sp.]|nr:hypothetical protein [Lacunisphaera sp.]
MRATAKPLHLKLGPKPGARAYLRHAPPFLAATLRLSGIHLAPRPTGKFDFIVAGVTTAAALPRAFRLLKPRLRPDGKLWIAWPKRDRADPLLKLTEVIRIGYDHGLVESKCISLDPAWSALKFTFPKPGQTYRNRYGRLGHREKD